MELNIVILEKNIEKLGKIRALVSIIEYEIVVNALAISPQNPSDVLGMCDVLIIEESFPDLTAIIENLSRLRPNSVVLFFGQLPAELKGCHPNIFQLENSGKLIPLLSVLDEVISNYFSPGESKRSNVDFFSVKITQFLKLTKAPCDLYIKLSEQKYLKCINEDDEFLLEIIKRYQDKSFQFFYLKKDDYYKCFDFIFDGLLPKESDYLNSNQAKEIYFSNSQHVIYDLMNDLDIGENIIQLSEELIQDVCKEYKNSDLSTLFDKFKYSKERYIFDHSTMTSMFAIAICSNFEWRNTEIYKKLTMAAIYHDFGFANPKLALIEQDSEEIKNLSKSFRREILDHPEVIAQKLSSFKGVSGETISMVLKHHEAHGEEGYPKKLSSAHLSVLECIFITAHEFSNQIYRIAFRQDKMHLAIHRTLEFLNNGNLKTVRDPFLKMIKNEYLKQAP